jgi:geranylgeranyl transferase type-2 subunit beta
MVIRRCTWITLLIILPAGVFAWCGMAHSEEKPARSAVSPADILAGVRSFFKRTAQADGSFRPGIDPDYPGMADTAYSDLAAPTYAAIIYRTFGWHLPHEAQTRTFFLSRQKPDGAFCNVRGTVDPHSSAGRLYNTTQGLVGLHALGLKPKYDPRPVFDQILKQDYHALPVYSTSFFPLAYRTYGKPYPSDIDRKIRTAFLKQAPDGYLNEHIAATFHAVHYNRLLGRPTPKADGIRARTLREQMPNGSWLRNPPARDRHATFDAVFVLRQLGHGRADCRKAIAKAAGWALRCRNADGGFGHYPGSPSDADAVYFQVGVLVMAGVLAPARDLPHDAALLGWGHLLPKRGK